MNLLRRIIAPFAERRVQELPVPVERRGGIGKRLKDASDRVNNAVDDLCKTVSMSREDFNEMIERDRIQDVGHFAEFSEKCEFRYINGDGVTSFCRNPEHEKICTGREVCGVVACPRLKKR